MADPGIIHGVVAGRPGPPGSPAIGWSYGAGSPLTVSDPHIGVAAVGSLYSDTTGGNLWFRGLIGWQQITIP
jgi:hypothetical protein